MSKLDEIKSFYLQARKSRHTDACNLLSTFIGELETRSKASNNDITDLDVVSQLKKFIAAADFVFQNSLSDKDKEIALEEKSILEYFLPKQLSNEQLLTAIGNIIREQNITSKKQMGIIMKLLKERYDGQFDGSIASKLIGEILQ